MAECRDKCVSSFSLFAVSIVCIIKTRNCLQFKNILCYTLEKCTYWVEGGRTKLICHTLMYSIWDALGKSANRFPRK